MKKMLVSVGFVLTLLLVLPRASFAYGLVSSYQATNITGDTWSGITETWVNGRLQGNGKYFLISPHAFNKTVLRLTDTSWFHPSYYDDYVHKTILTDFDHPKRKCILIETDDTKYTVDDDFADLSVGSHTIYCEFTTGNETDDQHTNDSAQLELTVGEI